MKQYLLLRDNEESGPYSQEEFSKMGLRPLDLIWIEGTSTSWAYATELDELKTLVKEVPRTIRQTGKRTPFQPSVFPGAPDGEKVKELREQYTSFRQDLSLNEDFAPLIKQPELKERINQPVTKKDIWGRKFALPVNGATNVAAAFVGVILGAFLLKKAVDGTTTMPLEEVSVASMVMEEPVADKSIRNALKKEIVPVTEKPASKPKPRDIRKQVFLKGSEYKTGLLGGISDLNLTVINGSPHFIDKITVAVKYLKKNGEVIETEFFDLTDVKPRTSKSLVVPKKNRGVKVEYKVVNVSSQQYKASLKQV